MPHIINKWPNNYKSVKQTIPEKFSSGFLPLLSKHLDQKKIRFFRNFSTWIWRNIVQINLYYFVLCLTLHLFNWCDIVLRIFILPYIGSFKISQKTFFTTKVDEKNILIFQEENRLFFWKKITNRQKNEANKLVYNHWKWI